MLADAGFPIGDPTQWRLKKDMAGGGSLMDIGIYALNASRYLTGEEPVEVSAMEYTTPGDPRFREVEETITFQLRFPSGVLANCTSSYGAPFNRFRVVGTKGWAELEPALLLSIAPPAGRWEFESIPAPTMPWLVIQGEADEIVDPQAVYAWLEKLDPPQLELVRMPDTSHFFHRKLMDLRGAIKQGVRPYLPAA